MENIVSANKLIIKAKNTADIKQRSPWSKPLLTSYARGDKKTFSFTRWQKQIKVYVSFQKGQYFKLSTFSFKPRMLKVKAFKKTLWFVMFENTVKI